MKRKPVQSSNITAIGYNAEKHILEVEFKTGSIYHYENITCELASNLLNAPSVGKFFNQEIRSLKFNRGEFKEEIISNIYICGKAGAGKTYSAKYLMDNLGYVQAKFAYPVYGIAYDYFKMDKKDRLLLQTIGTDVAREVVGSEIWVDRFIEDTKIVQLTRKKMGLPAIGLVSDDTRFENEHEALKRAGWLGLYLNVPDEVRIERLGKRDGNAQVGTLQHSSEVAVDNFKDELVQIDASGTLEETHAQLDKIIEVIKAKA